jgi:hypothetical protein
MEKEVLPPGMPCHPFWMGIDIIWLEADWEPLTQSYRSPRDFAAIETAAADETWLRPWAIDDDVDALLAGFNSLFFLTDDMDPELHAALLKEFPVLQKVGILWDAKEYAPAMTMDLPGDESEHLLGALNPDHVQEYSDALNSMNHNRVLELLDDHEFGGEECFFTSSADFIDFLGRYSKGLAAAASKGVGILAVCYG